MGHLYKKNEDRTYFMRSLLNPISRFWDLVDGPPEPIVKSYLAFTRLRLPRVYGGDKTVSWIISPIDEIKLQQCNDVT